ncbi:MAG: RNase adapter RapZ [Proteobacteria bacterium]|nr:RNase adapter RapZ [Pseudomonadota bacterium]
MDARANARFVVITGLSGSGKSTVLKALEDMGFYAVDNLPAELLPAFVNLPLEYVGEPFKAALVMDVRTPRFVEVFPPILNDLLDKGYSLELIFLETEEDVLIRRFSQTRRQPPLAGKGESVATGLQRERELLEPLRSLATQVLDTSRFTIHQLKQEIFRLYSRLAPPARLHVNLMSFGYKYGIPREADLAMDVRFLANPYFVDSLRPLDGRDQRVVDYVFKQATTNDFLNRFKGLLDFLIPLYHKEGKSQLTVAIGCTGGKHRSVAISEWLAKELASPECQVTLRHRDVELG